MPNVAELPNKTTIRKNVSRGKFTVNDFAEGIGRSTKTARSYLDALVEAGHVERLDETQKVTNEDGVPTRGRPAQVFRVTKGRN